MTDREWQSVCDALRTHVGIALPSTMRAVVTRVVRDLGLRDPERDLARPELRERLLDRLFIGTTWFYREHAGLEALARALAQVSLQRPGRMVSVWSVGCATGQEPYALAMALDEHGCVPRIVASDFHRPSLESAREARYSAASCASLPTRWRERYVDVSPNGGQIRQELRSRVRFVHHNFAMDAALETEVDAVICRNVLIYFERSTAVTLVSKLASSCREGGYLLLGAIEAPLLWTVAGEPRTDEGTVPMLKISGTSPPQSASTLRSRDPVAPAPRTVSVLTRARDLDRKGDVEGALRNLDELGGSAAQEASLHLARGLLFKRMGRWDDAVRELRAARFLDPTSWLAPYQLAVCLERIGESDESYEAYRYAAMAIAVGGASGSYPVDEAIEMLAATTAAACRAKLQTARARAVLGDDRLGA